MWPWTELKSSSVGYEAAQNQQLATGDTFKTQIIIGRLPFGFRVVGQLCGSSGTCRLRPRQGFTPETFLWFSGVCSPSFQTHCIHITFGSPSSTESPTNQGRQYCSSSAGRSPRNLELPGLSVQSGMQALLVEASCAGSIFGLAAFAGMIDFKDMAC